MTYTIAIVGAGIGGLAAGAYLARAGHKVHIFDRFETPAPVGSGLVIQPVGQQVLKELDVEQDALELGQKVVAMEGFETGAGLKVLGVSYGDSFGLAIHRASLFHCLLTAATKAGAELVPSAEVSDFDRMHLVLGDKQEGPFDLIINASGANSALSPLQARPLKYGAIWGTVPWPEQCELPTDQLQQRYKSASRMIGILPVGRLPGDKTPIATVFWSLKREDYHDWREAPLQEWKDEAASLWPEMAPFLTTITDHSQMAMAKYTHGSLRNPVRGRIVHLGDAAHRASPQLGQGANMALLDACALARAIKDPDIDMGLRSYTLARKGHVWLYQMISALFTPQYQSDSRILPWIRDRLLYPITEVNPTKAILTRLVRGDLVPPLGSLR